MSQQIQEEPLWSFKLAVLSSVDNICLSHYNFEEWGLLVLFFVYIRYQIGNYSVLKICFGPVVLCFAFIMPLSHQHERRSHLLEVYGSRWWDRHSWMQPRYGWRRPYARAGSSSAACAPAACGSEEAGQGTLWNKVWQFLWIMQCNTLGNCVKYS